MNSANGYGNPLCVFLCYTCLGWPNEAVWFIFKRMAALTDNARFSILCLIAKAGLLLALLVGAACRKSSSSGANGRPVRSTFKWETETRQPGDPCVVAQGTNIEFQLVWIPSTVSTAWSDIGDGRPVYRRGSPPDEAGRDIDETAHDVKLTQGFWMGRYEITQEQYTHFAEFDPSRYQRKGNPVENVSWNDAKHYCMKLSVAWSSETWTVSADIARSNWYFRLPTEAEWEYACRAGTKTRYWCGNLMTVTQANFHPATPIITSTGRRKRTFPKHVGRYQPNPWGLYDMHGNLSEWCEDWYGPYPPYEVTDPKGPPKGSLCVYRGGSWYNTVKRCRSAERLGFRPLDKNYDIGFRLVLALKPEK